MTDIEQEIAEVELDLLAEVICQRMREGDAWGNLQFTTQDEAATLCLLATAGCSASEARAYLLHNRKVS